MKTLTFITCKDGVSNCGGGTDDRLLSSVGRRTTHCALVRPAAWSPNFPIAPRPHSPVPVPVAYSRSSGAGSAAGTLSSAARKRSRLPRSAICSTRVVAPSARLSRITVTGIRVPVAQISPPQTCGLLLRNSCQAAICPVYVGAARGVHSPFPRELPRLLRGPIRYEHGHRR